MTICIVHSTTVPDWKPTQEGLVRIDYAASILGKKVDDVPSRINKILLVGWRATPGLNLMNSEVAREILLERWIDKNKILIEEDIPWGATHEKRYEKLFLEDYNTKICLIIILSS